MEDYRNYKKGIPVQKFLPSDRDSWRKRKKLKSVFTYCCTEIQMFTFLYFFLIFATQTVLTSSHVCIQNSVSLLVLKLCPII